MTDLPIVTLTGAAAALGEAVVAHRLKLFMGGNDARTAR